MNTVEHHGNRLYGFMGLQSKMSEWVSGFEEKEGVMRNAMTTRAPGGAKNKSVSMVRSHFKKITHFCCEKANVADCAFLA